MQVQEIFGGLDEEGGLGDGFVEACLSVMNWSTEVNWTVIYKPSIMHYFNLSSGSFIGNKLVLIEIGIEMKKCIV